MSQERATQADPVVARASVLRSSFPRVIFDSVDSVKKLSFMRAGPALYANLEKILGILLDAGPDIKRVDRKGDTLRRRALEATRGG